MRKILFTVLVLAIAQGCSNSSTKTPAYVIPSTQKLESSIAICGAGFDSETGARLAAEWESSGGKITAGFQEYVRSAIFNRKDITSSDKQLMYQNYINCVLEIDRRTKEQSSTCEGKCESIKNSCTQSVERTYANCIGKSQNKCIDNCVKKWGNSFDSCRLDHCDPNKPLNINHWDKLSCNTYKSGFDSCESNYQECLAARC